MSSAQPSLWLLLGAGAMVAVDGGLLESHSSHPSFIAALPPLLPSHFPWNRRGSHLVHTIYAGRPGSASHSLMATRHRFRRSH